MNETDAVVYEVERRENEKENVKETCERDTENVKETLVGGDETFSLSNLSERLKKVDETVVKQLRVLETMNLSEKKNFLTGLRQDGSSATLAF